MKLATTKRCYSARPTLGTGESCLEQYLVTVLYFTETKKRLEYSGSKKNKKQKLIQELVLHPGTCGYYRECPSAGMLADDP